jgi:hypothetical protein
MKLRFFCDLCGTEVPRNTIRCPNCGRYFTAIQCPRCGFQGEEKDFVTGCPSCGYMKATTATGRNVGRRDGVKRSKDAPPRRPKAVEEPGPAPPAGLYRLIGLILAAILIALVVILFVR